jgi:hypothetical protein
MGPVWRRPLVSLALLGALLTGCSHHSSGRGATSTSRTGGSSGDTLSTTGPPPSGVHGVWFASDKEGWALAEEPCPKPGPDPAARCAAVWKTSDGAETWTRLTGLDVPPKGAAGTDAVDAVRFADAQHGWVYDRSLLATFSGGKRWLPVDLGAPVTDVEVAGSQAYALVGACDTGAGNCTEPMRIAEGTIATGRWRFAGLGFDMPATDTGTLIANRSSIYAWVTGPSAQLFLARTTAGRWERRTPPCARPIVAPITDEDGLVAACLPAMNAGPVELQTSSDGGRSWAVVWHSSFARTVTSLAVTGTAAVVGLENGDVLRTTDNGMHFVSVLRSGGNAELQFVDGDHGFATAGPDGRRQLFSTDDGGATWKALRPPA